jgi:hypothetical protein
MKSKGTIVYSTILLGILVVGLKHFRQPVRRHLTRHPPPRTANLLRRGQHVAMDHA